MLVHITCPRAAEVPSSGVTPSLSPERSVRARRCDRIRMPVHDLPRIALVAKRGRRTKDERINFLAATHARFPALDLQDDGDVRPDEAPDRLESRHPTVPEVRV